MSYKKQKLKKNKIDQLKYKLKKIKIVLLKNIKKLRKEEDLMRFREVNKVTNFLRKENKIIRQNNLKINEWVDDYLLWCTLNGKSVDILTQWCLSKDLEERFKKQGGKFIPTRKERRFFETEIPRIVLTFTANRFRPNWWITFNRSYLDMGRITKELEGKYEKMIRGLVEELPLLHRIVFINWEEEVLNDRPKPSREILTNFQKYIPQKVYEIEFEKHSKWAREEAGLNQTDKELEADIVFKLACEAEEGKFLMSKDSPFENGEFILIPLEAPERYDFFRIFAKDFKKRIVSVVSSYPWRLKD